MLPLLFLWLTKYLNLVYYYTTLFNLTQWLIRNQIQTNNYHQMVNDEDSSSIFFEIINGVDVANFISSYKRCNGCCNN